MEWNMKPNRKHFDFSNSEQFLTVMFAADVDKNYADDYDDSSNYSDVSVDAVIERDH